MKDRRKFTGQTDLITITRALQHRSGLHFLNIIPIEAVGYENWAASAECPAEVFNTRLGAAAADIVWKQLRKDLALAEADRAERFRIGLAGGGTIYWAIEKADPIEAGRFESVEVAPLVIGDVPGHRFSAGTVAEMLAAKMTFASRLNVPNAPKSEPVKPSDIETWEVPSDEAESAAFRVSLRNEIREGRRHVGRPEFTSRDPLPEPFDFDYILVGIGQYGAESAVAGSNLAEHIKTIYGETVPVGLCGDICSRLFNSEGRELDPRRGDSFCALSLAALAHLVRRPHQGNGRLKIIAIAGGHSKVSAIATVIKMGTVWRQSGHTVGPVINGLITDELTAELLIRQLPVPRPAAPDAKSTPAGRNAGGNR